MTKILGLDLGTNSIGWAVVDKTHNKILNAGVRIFPEGVVKETIGQGDKEISKNAERREHRQARRLNYRKRLRKIKLLQVLIDNKMCPLTIEELNGWKNWDKSKKSDGKRFPDGIEFIEWLKLNPYILREKAINDKISLLEFGRIMYHFIQRRGFLSSRKGGEDGAIFKGKDNMEGIDDTRKLLDGKTLGQKMYEIMPKENETFKRILDDTEKDMRIRARYTLREMYVDEFEKIWNKQADRLGLINIKVNSKKEISINGTLDSKENRNKILSLENKYGKSNIIKGTDKLIVSEAKPFKEFIAGKIETSEEGLKFKSDESVLFWQRPLRSQKGLLGKCTFEKRLFFDKSTGKKITIGSAPSPVSHPEYELFRAYQFINNIRYGKNQVLNNSQREIVLDLINNNDKNFDFEKVVSVLKMTYEFFNFEKDYKVPANPTHKRLKSYFAEEQWENSKNEIWHCFSFYDDPDMLADKLVRSYGLTIEKAQKAAKQKIVDGYGSVSLKAIRNILPFLEKGYQYSTAVILGGVKNAFGSRWDYFEGFHEEIINKVIKLINSRKYQEYEFINELKELLADPENKYGFSYNDKSFRKLYHHSQETEKRDTQNRLSAIENIRNPIVQRGINEMRRLVNALIDKYSCESEYGEGFSFDRIHVEMGRELRSGKNQRKEMAYKLNLNEKANEEARMRVSEYGLKPSRDNIVRYRLFSEIEEKHGHAICPYTNQTITIKDLLGGRNAFQIEHIIPYSISLDDSFNNKTLCESNFNRLKGELTPYEFYQKNSDPTLWRARSWEEIERRAYSLLPYLKAKKFTSKKRPQENDFIERQLNDTRYIAVKAASILKEICPDVRVMPGQLTAELRRLWGLNNIIQPVLPLNLDGYSINEDESISHYVVIDSNGIPRQIIPEMAEKPLSSENQIIIPGLYDAKKLFLPESKHQKISFQVEANGLPKGKYWLKLNISKPFKFIRIFTERPDGAEDRIIYRGLVSDKKFINESLQKKIYADRPDGVYWAVFKIKKSTFVAPEKGKQPSISKNQVLLFGEIRENIFSSYIYSCETNMIDGKYWVVLDIELENADFLPAYNKPNPEDGEYFLEGTVDDNGVFSADTDLKYQAQTQLASGKYYAVVSVMSYGQLFPVKNDTPTLNKGESLVEGNVWVNKQTGEIMFDPKKNRDDHRHHAVDAITIALTELSYLQKLSHYFGEFKEKERGIGDRPVFAPPWTGFSEDVKKAVDNILISYHRNNKVLSKISKLVAKSGKTYQSVGYAARGRLHREFYFGQHPSPILHSNKNGNDLKYEMGKDGLPIYYYHIRKPVGSLKNNKHVNKIVDNGIRELIEKRLQEVNQINTLKDYTIPDGFFFDENKCPSLYLNNKNGDPVPVRKVRMKENIGKAVQLKDGINQWVNPYNNHHVVIYQGKDGQLKEQVVTFWEVVERIQQGEPIYKLPEDGRKLITTLQENEMFLIGLPQEITDENNGIIMNVSELSKYLYRVQKLSSMYYTFRHHLASTVINDSEEIRIQSMKAWDELKPIKVKIDLTGKITLN